MIFRHFFWDFDGTLYDTYGRISHAMQKSFAECGLQVSFDTVYKACKYSLHDAWERIGKPCGIPEAECLDRYHAHAEDEGDSFIAYPGMADTLRLLSEKPAVQM